MADVFLKLDGIPGESRDAQHTGQIEVLSWSWGVAQVAGGGGGGGAGRPVAEDLSYTALASKAGPLLFDACASGRRVARADLFVRRAGAKPVEYLHYILTDVLVASYRVGGSDPAETAGPIEQVSLDYSRLAVEYREIRPDGSLAPVVSSCWDFRRNARC